MMIRSLLITVLLSVSLPVLANDFVLHDKNTPQNLDNKASVQVINFWATWCAPCRKEMPAMDKWYQQKGKAKKVQMVGIAVDNEDNISKFLATTPVHYPIWRYIGNNSRAMMKSFGNNVGALPYTVVRAPKCQAEQKLIGEVDGTKLDKAITDVLAKCA